MMNCLPMINSLRQTTTLFALERFGMEHNLASMWVKIGSRYDELVSNADKFSPDYTAIYNYTRLPSEQKTQLLESLEDGNPQALFSGCELVTAKHGGDRKSAAFQTSTGLTTETTKQQAEEDTGKSRQTLTTWGKDALTAILVRVF